MIVFLLFSFVGYGFSKFKSEQKFYNEELNKELKDAFISLDNLEINKNLEAKLLNDLADSKGNDYYTNRFNALLFQYYYLTGNLEKCYALFEREVARTDIESRLSYVSLLAEFHDAFNQISYKEYTDQILKRIRFIGNSLDGDEKKWVEFNIQLKESLSYKNNNLYVNRDNLQKSVEMLDDFSDMLSQEEYFSIKTKTYNYLAINYMEFIRGNIKEVDVNKIDHAISLFKKSLRFNDGKRAYITYVVYTNLSYVYNVKGDYEESISYSLKAKELLKNSDSNFIFRYRFMCNLADSYSIKSDEENLSIYYPLCIDGLDRMKKLETKLINIIYNNPVVIPEKVNFKNPSNSKYIYISLVSLLVIVGSLFWFNKRSKKK